MGKIKDKWSRFREWQQSPVSTPQPSHTECTCKNCGESFTGNYCPTCGQSATVEALSWRSIMKNAMEVWGMGSRSLPRTLLHLVLRPGYLIADYLQGRRQQYFAPIKTLFLVAALLVILKSFAPDFVYEIEEETQNLDKAVTLFFQVLQKNRAIFSLIVAGFAAIFLRFFFNNTPRMGKLNFCSCVFVQIWISIQLTMLRCLTTVYEFFFTNFPTIASYILIFMCFLISYKQLFGLSWKSTIWRTLAITTLALAITILIMSAIVFVIALFMVGPDVLFNEIQSDELL